MVVVKEAGSQSLCPPTTNIPHIPPEIEYEIFVLAFYTAGKRGRTTLFRVAKRVAEWLIPLLYKTILIEHDSYFASDSDDSESNSHNCPPISALRIYGHLVRNIWGYNGSNAQLNLLALCPNASNMAFWFGTTITSDVLDLPVTKLTIGGFGFLKERWDTPKDIDIDDPSSQRDGDMDTKLMIIPWCSNITHLAFGGQFDETTAQYLTHFPALKYLMVLEFNDPYGRGVEAALKVCSKLEVVIRLLGPVEDKEKTQVVDPERRSWSCAWSNGERERDERIVEVDALVKADWLRGAKGGWDMWDIAQREVGRRLASS